MSGLRLRVVTPACLTTSGNSGKARLIRFWTSTWAKFRLTPGLNVTDRLYEPSLLDSDSMYIMSSTPLICCSIGAATVSATTLALAPGYDADTSTVGGAISGYCAIGSVMSAMPPARVITIDSTEAKIGRLMKNLENTGKKP